MKIFVVLCNSWNGEFDVNTPVRAFYKVEDANKFAEDAEEAQPKSSYADTFEVEEVDLE